MIASIVVQGPAGGARQLFVLFHGAEDEAVVLAPLGRRLAATFPEGFVVVLPAPAQAAEFLDAIASWQARSGVAAEATAVLGFGRGAAMALESTKAVPACAARVVALAGWFESQPTQPATETTVHLFHGKEDAVTPYSRTVAAAQCLLDLGTDVTADVVPFVGHEITDEMATLVLERLRGYLPQRRWREALEAAEAAQSPGMKK